MRSIHRLLISALAGVAILAAALPVSAAPINDKMQKKVDVYKKQMVAWAADPLIVSAVKDANAKGAIEGMGNAKWKELKEADPVVSEFVTNATGKLLTKWMEADAKSINKIVLSGVKSQRVAYTSMPAKYLGKGAPNFDTSMNDAKVWQQDESKPDPSTNIDTVQISAPVQDGGKVIGVLLVSLTADALKK